jgi:hypothetical protein
MSTERIGVLIGGTFGLVFVLVNAGSLPSGVSLVLRAVAILALVGLVGYLVTRPDSPPENSAQGGSLGFSRGYWWVVIAEVVAIWAGIMVIGRVFDAPQANVAWIALVVGVHFSVLAIVWKQPVFHWLGGVLAACGVVGLLLAVVGASSAAIDVVGGIVPGFLLLGFTWVGTVTRYRGTPVRSSGAPEARMD